MTRVPACQVSPDIQRYAGVANAIYQLSGNQPERTRRGCIYTVDPSLRRCENALSHVSIPYEPLRDGITGAFFAVDPTDATTGIPACRPCLPDNADDDFLDQGLPQSHCRNAYFVAMHVYEMFRRALGRPIAWSFWTADSTPPIRLVPFGIEELNAWYDPALQEVRFGFGAAPSRSDGSDPDDALYRHTALSSDVVAHEITHALLDGLRPGYDLPVNLDVAAFHEAIADIVALMSRFERPAYLQSLLRQSGDELMRHESLVGLAPELGKTLRRSGLRTLDISWTDADPKDGTAQLPRYGPEPTEPHKRGGLLASAVLEAFLHSVARRVDPLMRMTRQANGATHAFLLEEIAKAAARTASHFLTICIRALDYMPPAALIFPDYLRAMVTADRLFSPRDLDGYREELIGAFRRRGIFPEGMTVLSDSTLAWQPPDIGVYPIPGLALGEMRFGATPTLPHSAEELDRQAMALAHAIDADPALCAALGLRDPGISGPHETISPPTITAIRPALRTGPSGIVDFSTIAEITQVRNVHLPETGTTLPLKGGATLVCDFTGKPTYIVRQRVDNADRIAQELDFARSAISRGWLVSEGGKYVVSKKFHRRLCDAAYDFA